MSFLSTPNLVLRSTRSHDVLDTPPPKHSPKEGQLKSRSSIGNLLTFAKNPLGNISEAVEDWYDGSTKETRAERQAQEDKKQLLYVKLRTASTRDAWENAAIELDELEGNNAWKSDFDSAEYDAALVQTRLKQMNDARISCDIGRMLFLIRTSLTRNLGDMGNTQMYRHSHIGTKDLVENYIASVLGTLDALLDVSAKAKCDGMESRYILEQLLSSRQAFGRSALLLSGGATFGMNHIGVLKALWEAKLLPRIISGASAGSIVCAVVCTRIDEEMPDLLSTFCEGSLDVFDEEGGGDNAIRKVVRFLKHGALYDIENLTRIMKGLLGDITFQEAYNRTRKILNITVSSASLYELPRLLNYITAPNVLIWSAVAASCSVPLIFTSASLLAKDPRSGQAVPWNPLPQRWIDGSVDNDIPMTRLAEMFNVNHFIVSQVNPHVVPFLLKEEGFLSAAPQEDSKTPVAPGWIETLSLLAKGEALHRMHTLADFGVLPNLLTKAMSVLSQKYSGDITILPEISYADFPRMLSNPTPGFMEQAMITGERATWPKMSIIKNHCAIELALDDAVQKLRTRVVFEPEEIELRKEAHVKRNSLTGSHRTIRKRSSKSRPLSQNSAQEPLQGRPPSAQKGNRPGSSQTNERSPYLAQHKQSRSIGNVPGPSPNQTRMHDRLNPAAAHAYGHPSSSYEITSSAAEETSNMGSRSSSSTSLDLSSSPDVHATKRPSSLRSASQPSTPLPHTSPSSPTLARTAQRGSFMMTPATQAAESKYRRIFHSSKSSASNAKGAASGKQRGSKAASPSRTDNGNTSRSAERSGGMRRNWGLEIDIPATAKGLVGRGKKKE